MLYEQKLLAALEHWENLGNTPEELGAVLEVATRNGILPIPAEVLTARCKVRALPYGTEILETELRDNIINSL